MIRMNHLGLKSPSVLPPKGKVPFVKLTICEPLNQADSAGLRRPGTLSLILRVIKAPHRVKKQGRAHIPTRSKSVFERKLFGFYAYFPPQYAHFTHPEGPELGHLGKRAQKWPQIELNQRLDKLLIGRSSVKCLKNSALL